MIVSFDFDGTLSEKEVQSYAKYLLSKGITVMVHTNRPPSFCKDVFKFSYEVGISADNVRFCGDVGK